MPRRYSEKSCPSANGAIKLRRALVRFRFRQWARLLAVVALIVSGVGIVVGPPLLGSIAAGVVLLATIGMLAEGIVRDRDPAQGGFVDYDEQAPSLPERLQAAERDYDIALHGVLRAWLSEKANGLLGDVYETDLPDLTPTGLAEVDGLEREVPTEARDVLEHLLEHMPAGTIGVAGPRGAGKTTVLHRLTFDGGATRNDEVGKAEGDEDEATIGIVVDAPVEYDAREFTLHLFARLCERVLGSRRVAELRRDRSLGTSGRLVRSPRPYLLTPGPLLFLAGMIVYLVILSRHNALKLDDLEPYALGAMLLGAMLRHRTLVTDMPSVRRWIRSRPVALTRRSPTATAEMHLRQIWFQRSISAGQSESLALPLGVGAAAEWSAQLTENQLNLPEVVDLYKDFVGLLASQRQVRIGIDELDKMDDQNARRFLDEIKPIFRCSNCFYFVSVSEDAMSCFERRGLPFRDVFDSSFDEVVHMGYLPYPVARRMLRKRVVGLPVQFACLCHILGGGLARDVIRVAREVCGLPAGTSLEQAVTQICRRQLEHKRRAASLAVRRLRDPDHIVLLGAWLRGLESATPTSGVMLGRCHELTVDLVKRLGEPPREDAERLREHWEALSIALDLMTFVYFVATLNEFVPTLDTEAATLTALNAGTVDGLAEARQAFARGPSEAWEAISDLRDEALGEEPLSFPRIRSGTDEPGAAQRY